MLESIQGIWDAVSLGSGAVINFLFRTHPVASLIAMHAIFILFGWRRIAGAIYRFRANRALRNRATDFSAEVIEQGITNHVRPECQTTDPSVSDEAADAETDRNTLDRTLDNILAQDTPIKFVVILAGSGIGKTAFLMNCFAHYQQRLWKTHETELFSLAIPGWEKRLNGVPNPGKTMLLLDALDSELEGCDNPADRLKQVMDITKDFHLVVFTCRTQLFPSNEEIAGAGIARYGAPEEERVEENAIYKLYLSPFREKQIKIYLKKRFPLLQNKKRKHATRIVKKIPDLALRPMLLANVDNLIESGKHLENSYCLYSAMVEIWLNREMENEENKEKMLEFLNKLVVPLFKNRIKRGDEWIYYNEIEPLAEKFRIDLPTWKLAGHSLLNRNANGNYKFVNRSIMEFFLARKILNGDEDATELPSDLWTEQVRRFFYEGKGYVHFDGGSFRMGNSQNPIEIEPFEMSVYPVTNWEYEIFDPAHRYKRDTYSIDDEEPVVRVSWRDASRYCAWLSRKSGRKHRLPTEFEWEYAASDGGKRHYPWGDEPPTTDRANYLDSKIGKTMPVYCYPKGMTSEGLHELAGNIWEWCTNWYDKEQTIRVLRGGSYFVYADHLQCSNRFWTYPYTRSNVVGFRVVRTVQ